MMKICFISFKVSKYLEISCFFLQNILPLQLFVLTQSWKKLLFLFCEFSFSFFLLEDKKLIRIVLHKRELNDKNIWKSLLANNEYPVVSEEWENVEKKLSLERFQRDVSHYYNYFGISVEFKTISRKARENSLSSLCTTYLFRYIHILIWELYVDPFQFPCCIINMIYYNSFTHSPDILAKRILTK